MHKIVCKALTALLFIGFAFSSNPLKYAKPKLSDYGFFVGDLAKQQPSENVLPYEVSAKLFSDYAIKSRFVVLPKGEQILYQSNEEFIYPVGSTLIKSFYYPTDIRYPEKNIRLMETRLLINTPEGWIGYPYVWNKTQTEAFLEIAGERLDVSFINSQGNKESFNYSVPNFNQCKGCHVNQNKMKPIGTKARLLNHDYEYPEGSMNQLKKWSILDMINNLPEISTISHTPNYNDPNDGTLEERARGWIDINCAHCHRLGAPGETSGLFLNIEEKNKTRLGIYKPPVAAGRATGNLKYTISPGSPEKSIMIKRMLSKDPGIMMPELGRKLVHKEGVELVSQWIKNMKKD
tara:strand:+ start:100 stop:1143 length:1044 start_codon:yes stop_codon:yes gene_type:complete